LIYEICVKQSEDSTITCDKAVLIVIIFRC